jgi:hypothetical protein
MNTTTRNLDIYLDGKPFELPATSVWQNFEEFCRICATHMENQGLAIRHIYVDGVEIDCSRPPESSALQTARKIEVTTCLLEDLLSLALTHQLDTTRSLIRQLTDLSTDCLIQLPQESFDKWKAALESLKGVVSFIPRIFVIQPLLEAPDETLSEQNLLAKIRQIQTHVDTSRRALEVQDIVQFSDTLELQIIPWAKDQEQAILKLSEAVSKHRKS